ncbi:hypothetical protein TNCV_2856271 [Trichonephila clavipes]|nr:hypothetical protein TNCV_2856271 [Trichonephila clavipes]
MQVSSGTNVRCNTGLTTPRPQTSSSNAPKFRNGVVQVVISSRYNVCTVRTGGGGTPKQTYMLLPGDVACHRCTLNILEKNPARIRLKSGKSDSKLNLDSSKNITQDHCCGVHNACSLLQVNRR